MKIVHLIAHLELGGAEVLVSNLIKYQVSKNQKMELWCLEKSKNIEFETKVINRLKDLNINVIILTEKKNKIKRIINLVKNINRFKPDIVNSHLLHVTMYTILGKFFSFRHNLKIVETIHSTSLSKTIYHQIISNYLTNKTVAITEKVKENLINEAKIKKDKIVVIENGIELSEKKNELKKNVKKIICVGRLSPEKNHIFLLKAYKLLKKEFDFLPFLEIYGEGVLSEVLKEYIETNNLESNIKLMGTSLNIIEKLKESDLYIMTSKYEGLSISLLEALGLGLPTIVTKVPGILDIVTDKEVAFVELDNVEELKNTIKNLIENYEKREEYSKEALKCSKKYSLKEKAVEYDNLYKDVYIC